MIPAWGKSWGVAWGRSWGWSAIIDIHDGGDGKKQRKKYADAQQRLRDQLELAIDGPAGAEAVELMAPYSEVAPSMDTRIRIKSGDIDALIARIEATIARANDDDEEDALMVLNG